MDAVELAYRRMDQLHLQHLVFDPIRAPSRFRRNDARVQQARYCFAVVEDQDDMVANDEVVPDRLAKDHISVLHDHDDVAVVGIAKAVEENALFHFVPIHMALHRTLKEDRVQDQDRVLSFQNHPKDSYHERSFVHYPHLQIADHYAEVVVNAHSSRVVLLSLERVAPVVAEVPLVHILEGPHWVL